MIVGALMQGFAQAGTWFSAELRALLYYNFFAMSSVYADIENAVVAMYIIARILLGFGIVLAIVSGSAMLGELAYPKE